MNTFIRNTLAALVVASAGVAASAPAANAGGVGFQITIGGGGHGGHSGWNRNVCKPRTAINKASHMGVRHASIARSNHRNIVVSGTRHHHSVRVVFANDKHCRVLSVRR